MNLMIKVNVKSNGNLKFNLNIFTIYILIHKSYPNIKKNEAFFIIKLFLFSIIIFSIITNLLKNYK